MTRDVGQTAPSRCFAECEREQLQQQLAKLHKEQHKAQRVYREMQATIALQKRQLAEAGAALKLVPDTGFEIDWRGGRMWALSIVRFRQIEKKLKELDK